MLLGLVGGGRFPGLAGQGNGFHIFNHAFVCGSFSSHAISFTFTSVAIMASEFLTAAMYFDNATALRYFSSEAEGIDNNGWSGNVVPFAPSSEEQWIALKKFARAYQAGYIDGPPKLLMIVRIPARFAVEHFVARDIQVLNNRPEATIGFAKPVNKDSFPSMHVELAVIEDEVVSSRLLTSGLQLLS